MTSKCDVCLRHRAGMCRYRGMDDPAMAPVSAVKASRLCVPLHPEGDENLSLISEVGYERCAYISKGWDYSRYRRKR